MVKFRHRDQLDLREQNLKRNFSWINDIKPIPNFIQTVSETWSIKFRKDIITIKEEQIEFEKFIRNFFITQKRRKGVIFLWQHRGVIIVVQ